MERQLMTDRQIEFHHRIQVIRWKRKWQTWMIGGSIVLGVFGIIFAIGLRLMNPSESNIVFANFATIVAALGLAVLVFSTAQFRKPHQKIWAIMEKKEMAQQAAEEEKAEAKRLADERKAAAEVKKAKEKTRPVKQKKEKKPMFGGFKFKIKKKPKSAEPVESVENIGSIEIVEPIEPIPVVPALEKVEPPKTETTEKEGEKKSE